MSNNSIADDEPETDVSGAEDINEMDAVGDNQQECVSELANWMLLNSRNGYPVSGNKLKEYFTARKRGKGFSLRELLRQTEASLSDVFGFQIEGTGLKPDTVEESGALNTAIGTRKQRKKAGRAVFFNLVYQPESQVDEEEEKVIINEFQYTKTDMYSKRRQAERSFLVMILIAIFLGGGKIAEDELKAMIQNYCKVSWNETQHPVLGDVTALLIKLTKQKMLYKQKVCGTYGGDVESILWHAGTRANVLFPKSFLYKAYKAMLGDEVSMKDSTYKKLVNVEMKTQELNDIDKI